jgi:hypothetical protein
MIRTHAWTELPPDYWTTAEVMKEIFETRVCLAKTHASDACHGTTWSAGALRGFNIAGPLDSLGSQDEQREPHEHDDGNAN